MATDDRYPWTRLTHPVEVEPVRDASGWVVPGRPWQDPRVRPLGDLREVRAVVLLGERGYGKSDALRCEHERLLADKINSEFLDLAKEPVNQIEGLVSQALAACVGAMQHVLLDGLDDAPRAAEFDRFLAHALNRMDQAARENLRLRISCRTSRWPPLLEERIAGLWADGYQRVHLAGLTRDDAAVAARQHSGLDVEAFLTGLERDRLVVPLASWPVTFAPLLKAAASGAPVPRTISEAYEMACRQLCTEKPAATLADPRDGAADADELIPLARRSAAALQFCARTAITDTADEPGTMPLQEIAGGTEPLDAGGEFACTPKALKELTESGLLAPTRPDGRWVFSHRSYQEYLAARHLHAHRTGIVVLRSLVMVGDGSTRRAASQQREAAAWIATFNDQMFDELVRCDPQTLLLGDLAVRSSERRLQVFDALLQVCRDGTPLGIDHSLLHQIDNEFLPSRLEPLLDPATAIEDLYFALSCANACPREELAERLLSIAEATALPEALRSMALNALTTLNTNPDVARRLKPLAGGSDPDVAAHAIGLLWPQHLDVGELLSMLPRPRPNYLGQAAVFLQQVPSMIAKADMPEAARWCADTLAAVDPQAVQPDEHAKVAVRLAARIIESGAVPTDSQNPTVVDLAKVALALVDLNLNTWQANALPTEELAEALDEHTQARRTIARAALAIASQQQIRALCQAHPARLFRGIFDSGFWATQLPALPANLQALLTRPLLPIPADTAEWETVFTLRQAHPELEQPTQHWYEGWKIGGTAQTSYADQIRRQATRQAQREALRFDETALRAALSAITSNQGDQRGAWRNALVNLYRTESGDPSHVPDNLDLTTAPSYPTHDTALADNIKRAAVIVLSNAPAIGTATVSGQGLLAFHDAPEILGLNLLREDDLPALDADRWAGLAIAFTCMQIEGPHDRALRDELLLFCAEQAAGRFEVALPDLLDRLGQPWLENVMSLMPQQLTPSQCAALFGWACASGCCAGLAAPVLRCLAQRQHADAIQFLHTWIGAAPSRLRGALTSAPSTRWLEAADILIQCGDASAWPRILRTLESVPDLGAPLLARVARAAVFGTWLGETEGVSSSDLGRLFAFMADQNLGAASLPTGTSGFTRPSANELRTLRHVLLQIIANRRAPDSLEVLTKLAARYPQDSLPADARERALDLSWVPVPGVTELVKIIANPISRLANDQYQLRDIVLESLGRLQVQLRASNSWATALWNQDHKTTKDANRKKKTRTIWWPTWENDFSDFVATFLRYDLRGQKVIVNREVELVRPGLGGSRTDIQVEAQPIGGPLDPDPLTVVIESKGCWNTKDLNTGLRDQLVAKYLKKPGRRAGIYLIAFFDDPAWREPERRTDRKHADHTIDSILKLQLACAAEAMEADPGITVTATVLDCRLPGDRVKEPANP